MVKRGASVAATVLGLIAVGLMVSLGTGLMAQPATTRGGNTEQGRELAEKLCVGCHQISPERTSPGIADVPSFAEIANRPGRTPQRLIDSMMLPHPPMPDVSLSRPSMDDLVAYILTHKKPD